MNRLLVGFVLLFGFSAAAEAATVTSSVTANKLTIDQPGSITLTWTASGAGKCIAGGDWSGSKNVAGGSETISITKTSTFSIACESPTGPAKVFWTPPNPAANAIGYRIFSGPAADQTSRLVEVPGITNTSVNVQTGPGLTYFTVRTYDSNGVESVDAPAANATQATKTVVADKSTSTVTVELAIRPPPATNVGVQ